MSYVYTVIALLSIIMVSTLVHEYGHYWTSRMFGVRVDEFAVGMGKKLFEHKGKNGTVFTFRLLPIGGFCMMNDEDFEKITRWKRAVILSMGCIHNIMLAVVPLTAVALIRKGLAGVQQILSLIWGLIKSTVDILPKVFDFSPENITGPAGLVTQVEGMTHGYTPAQVVFLIFAGLTAINIILAVFNILPIPALDGGQIMFLGIDWLYEKITGKLIPKKVFGTINALFFAAIMGYSIILLFADFWLPFVSK